MSKQTKIYAYGMRAMLTTEHAASSYGVPVLVFDGSIMGGVPGHLCGIAYGPDDRISWDEDCRSRHD